MKVNSGTRFLLANNLVVTLPAGGDIAFDNDEVDHTRASFLAVTGNLLPDASRTWESADGQTGGTFAGNQDQLKFKYDANGTLLPIDDQLGLHGQEDDLHEQRRKFVESLTQQEAVAFGVQEMWQVYKDDTIKNQTAGSDVPDSPVASSPEPIIVTEEPVGVEELPEGAEISDVPVVFDPDGEPTGEVGIPTTAIPASDVPTGDPVVTELTDEEVLSLSAEEAEQAGVHERWQNLKIEKLDK